MSAGRFNRSRYNASYDVLAIHPIRIQPETSAMEDLEDPPNVNAPPTGAITNPISAVVSLGNRQLGLQPRKFVLEYASGTIPPGYDENSVTVVPILTEAFFDSVPIQATVTYLDAFWTVVAKTPERVK